MDKKTILEEIKRRSHNPLTIGGLMRLLSVSKGEREGFKRLIKEMAGEGTLIKVRGNRYGIALRMNLITGRLEGHPDGYGFVIPDDGGKDVFINPGRLNCAMDGDRVVARVERVKGSGRREGSIIRILERVNRKIVGRFERERGLGVVIPLNERIPYDVLIPPKKGGYGIPVDKVVVAEIVEYPSLHRPPVGRLVEVLGDIEDPQVGVEVIVRKYGLPLRFEGGVLKESESVPSEVKKDEISKRVDLRGLNTVTIDGEEAKDFDDAVSIEFIEDGGCRLYVSVADVSAYVREGSEIDKEAYRRGTSVYFPGRVIPMLPEVLSNGICSLNPGKDRLAFTVIMEFDREGKVGRTDFVESVIRSKERLTYTEVKQILVDNDPELIERYKGIVEDLKGMERLCRLLRERRRMEKGSIDFDLPEASIVLDLRGRVEDIVREERNIAHFIIEEFMLEANRTVAGFMAGAKRPFLYRVHEPPQEEDMAFFREILRELSCPHTVEGIPSSKTLQAILRFVEGRPEERMVNHLLLRSMKQARYSEENLGHYALAFPVYTHFTSPIRRYPDLVVHRLLKAHIRGDSSDRWEEWKEGLPEIALHTSRRERTAMEAEREVVDLKKVEFMKDKVGEVFHGVVSGITSYGIFVELEEYPVEGMVHVSALKDDYYLYDESRHCLVGEHKKRIFRIGNMVDVMVERVDILRRRIDLILQ